MNLDYEISEDSSSFVQIDRIINNVIIDMRYYSNYNFIGQRIDGYKENYALLTLDAALALKNASIEFLKDGYVIKIFDAYRPFKALLHFQRWVKNDDTRMKEYFYKYLSKGDLIKKGYISLLSSHSRGSTVDITLVDIKNNKELDMGCDFDDFGDIAHIDYKKLTSKQMKNRIYLRRIMEKNGFKSLDNEWWHFTLVNEPYKDVYFDFDVKCLNKK